MRIGIVTTTFENYGSRLQNLATVLLLKKQYKGAKIETIVISRGKTLLRLLSKIVGNSLLSWVYLKLKFRGKINNDNKLLNYRAFFLKSDSLEEYSRLNNRYDLIVVGSDQIWKHYNYMTNFKFALFTKNKICNAPSFPVRELSKEELNFIIPLVSSFKELNFREQATVDYFNAHNVKCSCLQDPTLRVTTEEWGNLIKSNDERFDYLVYILNDEELYKKTLNEIDGDARIKSIFLVNKGTDKFRYSPLMFLCLLKNSDCIITNSFHGACFAKIFNKKLRIINQTANFTDCRFDVFKNYEQLVD